MPERWVWWKRWKPGGSRPWGNSHGGERVGSIPISGAIARQGLCARDLKRCGFANDGRAHNINADTVAGELAAALKQKLILIPAPRHPAGSRSAGIVDRKLRLSEARQLIEEGVVDGGMTPKTECCIRALAQGVAAAHIIDGRVPHALLLEVFTDAGIGTMVVGRG